MSTVAELLKKKLKVKKLGTVKDGAQEVAGDLKLDDIKAIAKEHFGSESPSSVKMVIGTCVSCGVTIDGKSAKEVVKEIQ